ncbi:tyrosine-type recombinase/integrase [Salinibacter ruber]|uniref:tyrosine-type recombinase/integrase n=1 Tax=Salinibacter ruber TaxID=146919 RepID=UPI000E58362E
MIRAAVAAGLCRSELVALQWQDVDLQEQCLYVRHRGGLRTKGNAEHRIPLGRCRRSAVLDVREGDQGCRLHRPE